MSKGIGAIAKYTLELHDRSKREKLAEIARGPGRVQAICWYFFQTVDNADIEVYQGVDAFIGAEVNE